MTKATEQKPYSSPTEKYIAPVKPSISRASASPGKKTPGTQYQIVPIPSYYAMQTVANKVNYPFEPIYLGQHGVHSPSLKAA
jgi:hypothetical protein